MRRTTVKHEFVHFIPDALQEGTVYVSIPFSTALHRCCCGCGSEVVTPLSPTDWELIFNGKTISLYPSIGSWALPCQSHYWIRRDAVIWDRQWSREEIEAGRASERAEKEEYFGQGAPTRVAPRGKSHRKVKGNK